MKILNAQEPDNFHTQQQSTVIIQRASPFNPVLDDGLQSPGIYDRQHILSQQVKLTLLACGDNQSGATNPWFPEINLQPNEKVFDQLPAGQYASQHQGQTDATEHTESVASVRERHAQVDDLEDNLSEAVTEKDDDFEYYPSESGAEDDDSDDQDSEGSLEDDDEHQVKEQFSLRYTDLDDDFAI